MLLIEEETLGLVSELDGASGLDGTACTLELDGSTGGEKVGTSLDGKGPRLLEGSAGEVVPISLVEETALLESSTRLLLLLLPWSTEGDSDSIGGVGEVVPILLDKAPVLLDSGAGLLLP